MYGKQRFKDRKLETNLEKDVKKENNLEKDVKKEKIINENIESPHKKESKVMIEPTRKLKGPQKIQFPEDSKESNSECSSEDESLNDVQKILTGKKAKNKAVTKSNTCKKVVTKTVNKFIFIGKSPGYKKKLVEKAEKGIPWYKRESILNKNEDSCSFD